MLRVGSWLYGKKPGNEQALDSTAETKDCTYCSASVLIYLGYCDDLRNGQNSPESRLERQNAIGDHCAIMRLWR